METLITLPLHLLILIQDIRERRISVITLSLLLVSVVFALTLNSQDPIPLQDLLFNEIMLGFQIGVTILAIKTLKGYKTKVIDHYLGLGDIVLLAICGLCFSSEAFFIFYFTSLVIGLFAFFSIKAFAKERIRELPFAAVLSFLFIVFTLSKYTGQLHLTPFNF